MATVQKVTSLKSPRSRAGLDGTDIANADELAAAAEGKLVYCDPLGGWLSFDGSRWIRDGAAALQLAKDLVCARFQAGTRAGDSRKQHFAEQSARRSRLDAAVYLAATEPRVRRTADLFDADPDLLNVANGVVDLRTGTLSPHAPSGHHTRLAPVAYDPAAVAPRWGRFLSEVFDQDDNLCAWVQRWCGYAATGHTREQVFVIACGSGANGKGVFVNTVEAALGDYFAATPVSTFALNRHGDPALHELAKLRGVRFAVAAEAEQGQTLAASRLKNITGEDTVSARHLYHDLFTYRFTAKLWLSTNYKPRIDGTDRAFARRLRVLPFVRAFEGARQEKGLKAILLAELPGVLRWIVDGAMAWHRDGELGRAHAERAATEAYLAEHDPVGRFLSECCVVEPDAQAGATQLYEAFLRWSAQNNERSISQQEFGGRLTQEGFRRDRDEKKRIIRRTGLKLLDGGSE